MLKDSIGAFKHIAMKPFSRELIQNYVTVRLEFELAYYDMVVSHISHNTMWTLYKP